MLTCWSATAEITVHLAGEGDYEDRASTAEQIGAAVTSPNFDFQAALGIHGDGRYGADIANWRGKQSFFNNYLTLDEGFLTARWDRLTFEAGREPVRELFDSPYTLFLNSSHPSLNGALYRYQDRNFTFENRWIELNRHSDFLTSADTPPGWSAEGATGFPDRGASLKTLVFRWGTQKFGIDDAAIYTGRWFDPEYFFSPLPAYFTQYVKSTAGRPWMTGTNENNLIGFFYQWDEPDFGVNAQVLVDDFSLYFLFPQSVPNNPWKVAWTFGGHWSSDWGTWGVYHAGATKYTFEPYSMTLGHAADTAYGYTLYPDVEYLAEGTWRTIPVEDNSLGYQHGENNVALMLTHAVQPARDYKLDTVVEATLSGSKSPANPWQEGTLALEYGTQMLNESPLEAKLMATSRASLTQPGWELWAQVGVGYVWHELKLQTPAGVPGGSSGVDLYTKIYRPSDTCRPLVTFAVGGRCALDLSQWLWGDDHD